jgi:asparagine synthase (glutamine-hydrolysing)
MPGLVGIISQSAVAERTLDEMIASIKYQGRYKVDKYVSPNCLLGRVHLGTWNPESQPIFNEDKNLCIFFDGKIYGHETRLEELKKRHNISVGNDAEFCLHSFEEQGKDFIKQLNGNFVLAIYDIKNRKIVIANDRLGFRVHYYAINDGRLLFAPEPKAILKDPAFIKELDEEAVAEFFTIGENWGEKTFFKGINVIRPATILTFDLNGLSKETYWRLRYEPDYEKSEEGFIDDLIRTLRKAVAIRMSDKHRYGVSLSGGLDSRTVISAMTPDQKKNLTACTFGQDNCDEIKCARKAAKKAKVKEHIILDVKPEDVVRNAEKDVRMTDGRLLLALSFVHPTYDRFKDRVDVMLDGYALDLTLGGFHLTKDKMECRSKKELREILRSKWSNTSSELADLLNPEFYQRVKDSWPATFEKEFEDTVSEHPGNIAHEFSMNTHVAWMHIGDVPPRTYLEISHPTSDPEFVDVWRRVPPELRINHYLYRKFLMKLSPELARVPYQHSMFKASAPLFLWKLGFKYYMGKQLIAKKLFLISKGKILLKDKHGYVNFEEWFHTNDEWRNFFREILLANDDGLDKILNRKYVETLLEKQLKGEGNFSRRLMDIATFKIFYRQNF